MIQTKRVIACFLLFVWQSAAAFRPVVAIQGAYIVTGAGADLPSGTVLLRDGLIAGVGAQVAVPPGATVIDGTGLTVYPGFIDGVSTWGLAAAAPAASGNPAAPAVAAPSSQPPGTPSSQPPGAPPPPRSHGPEDRPQTHAYERAADLITLNDSRLEAARAAGFTSAATFPNRGIVEGLGAMINLAADRGRDAVVSEPLGEQIAFRTGGSRLGFPASLMGNIAYLRQLRLDADQQHAADTIYAAHPEGNPRPPYDHNLAALAEVPRLLFPADRAQQIDRMLAFAREWRTPVVLYGLHEAFRRIDELKVAHVPVFVSLKWPEKPKDVDPAEVPNLRDLEIRDSAPAVPALLAKAGIRFGFFSDGITTAPELKKALRKAMAAGLSPADAVKALTSDTAAIYSLADRMGTIEPGKIANLVVSRGDVFADKPNIEYLFIDGVEIRPSETAQKGPAAPAGTSATHPQEIAE